VSPVRTSHGKARPENWRATTLPEAVASARGRDPKTGRFLPGNQCHRLRRAAMVRAGRGLCGLDPTRCEAAVRPYVVAGQRHAADLLAEVPEQARTALVAGAAEECAAARLVFRYLLSRALASDADDPRSAVREARSWAREARQSALALAGLSRTEAVAVDDEGLGWLHVDDLNRDRVPRSESTPGPRPRRGDPETRSEPQKSEVEDEQECS